MRLKGKVAVAIGAGRGIGLAISLALASEGADVVVAARTETEIEGAAERIRAAGARALAVSTDVLRERDVQLLFARAISEFAHVDILIYNSGTNIHRPLQDLNVADWDQILGVNLRGAFLSCKYALPAMLAQKSGQIVVVSSLAGREGVPLLGAYCAAKHGQIGLIEALEKELKGTGIHTHLILPGPVATKLRHENHPDEDPSQLIQPDDVAQAVIFMLLQPPTANVREIAVFPRLI
jgi:3-oxoacyl-[acyl-carrier protein] reductase